MNVSFIPFIYWFFHYFGMFQVFSTREFDKDFDQLEKSEKDKVTIWAGLKKDDYHSKLLI